MRTFDATSLLDEISFLYWHGLLLGDLLVTNALVFFYFFVYDFLRVLIHSSLDESMKVLISSLVLLASDNRLLFLVFRIRFLYYCFKQSLILSVVFRGIREFKLPKDILLGFKLLNFFNILNQLFLWSPLIILIISQLLHRS